MTQSDAQANVWVLQLTKVEMNMLLLVFKLSLKSQTEVFPSVTLYLNLRNMFQSVSVTYAEAAQK